MNTKSGISRKVKIFKMPFLRTLCPILYSSSGNTIGFWQCFSVIMLSATINFFKCVTKSCLKGFIVIQPIILHKLPHCNSICFFVILYSFPLVDVCRLLHIWIQLEITLYVNLIICLYMCSAETQLLIRVWMWLSILKLLFPFIRHPQ